MLINKNIKQTLEQLVSIHLIKGIQPSEIADAIFEKSYSDIKMSKTINEVHLIASFKDDLDEECVLHKMRYIYDQDKKLLSVEQKVGGKPYRVQWNRNDKISKIISTLSTQLESLNCPSSVHEFLKSIPEEYHSKIKTQLLLVA
jgi:hypothetical protein